jgi:hypothetical protein
VAAACADQFVGVRLEHLDHVHCAAAKRLEVARHRPHAFPRDRRRVEAGALQIILERHPRRRHVAGRRDAQADEIAPAELGLAYASDEQEWVARHHLPEADQRAARIGVVMHHHAHRPAPRNVYRAVEQRGGGARGARRDHVADVESLAFPVAAREREIERHVRHRAHVLAQRDAH